MLVNRVRIAIVLLAISLAICTAAWVSAGTTGVISGTVTNAEDGKPVSGANVIITNTKLSAVTDANGYFVITNVPPGDYEVQAEMIGFSVATVNNIQVTMDATATANFALQQEAIKETEAVVTRARPLINTDTVSTLDQVSAGQENLTRTDPASIRTVPGVLSSLPGVVTDPDGLGSIHIRGGRADQVGYYIEGIPIVDPNMGMFATNLFTTGIGKFQMYPGSFSAEFGNAISGVFNEVKKTGTQLDAPRLYSESGNESYRNAVAEFGGESPSGFNYYVSSVLQENDTDGGPMIRSQDYADNVAKFVWPWKNDTLTVLALQGSLAGFLDSYHDVTDNNAPTPHEKDFLRQRYTIGAVTWSHNFSPRTFMTIRPYYIYSTTTQNVMGAYGSFLNAGSTQNGLQVDYASQLNDQHLLKFGGSTISSNNNYYIYAGFPVYTSDVDTCQSSLYLNDHMKVNEKVTADAGVRYDNMVYDRTGQHYVDSAGYTGAPVSNATESTVTPRLGMSYSLDDRTAVKASWGKYTKFVPASSVQWIYFTPDAPYAESYTSGLGTTDPQRSTAMEASFEKQVSDSISYRVTPFYSKFTNLGDYVDVDGISHYLSLGEGKSTGVEFLLKNKMNDHLQGWLSYTWAKSRANRADVGLPSQMFYTSWDQRNTLSLVADYKNGKFSHTLRADFGSGREDKSSNPATALRADPYFVMTYGLTMNLPKGSRMGDSVYLNIYNLFNTHKPLQYTWDDDNRSVESRVPSRFISFGSMRAF